MTQSITELVNDEAVCRTAPATPGLSNKYWSAAREKSYSLKKKHTFLVLGRILRLLRLTLLP